MTTRGDAKSEIPAPSLLRGVHIENTLAHKGVFSLAGPKGRNDNISGKETGRMKKPALVVDSSQRMSGVACSPLEIPSILREEECSSSNVDSPSMVAAERGGVVWQTTK